MEKIVYYCDLCNQPFEYNTSQSFRATCSCDLCMTCVKRIVWAAIDSKTYRFRSTCKKCNGRGQFSTPDDQRSLDHTIMKWVDCDCGPPE